ncbi:MAG: hypothetical protein K0V04_05205 [Deltaproteobacteria bacterium]|nr:hypothetical protein [Deltaproteobacteria bacterium]
MATPIKYSKPRRINFVSVTLVLLLTALVYAAVQYFPLYLQRQDAYRVLEETGSELAGRARLYTEDEEKLEALRTKMQRKISASGIYDPKLETWIEIKGKEVRLGVVYSGWFEWPFDVFKRIEKVYEIEHVLVLP